MKKALHLEKDAGPFSSYQLCNFLACFGGLPAGCFAKALPHGMEALRAEPSVGFIRLLCTEAGIYPAGRNQKKTSWLNRYPEGFESSVDQISRPPINSSFNPWWKIESKRPLAIKKAPGLLFFVKVKALSARPRQIRILRVRF